MPTQGRDQQIPSAATDNEPRTPLTRDRVLRAALDFVDEHGLDALTMRKLGTALGVEGTALYNHVHGKDGILDGLVELLWAEVRANTDTDSAWQDVLRSLARSLRETAHRHPKAAHLACSRAVMPMDALQLMADCLTKMERAGFDRPTAARAGCAVFGHAYGYALMELMTRSCGPGEPEPETESQRIRRVTQALPPDVSDDLFDIGLAVCGCDTNTNFEAGIDLIIAGLRPQRRR
ncbi:MAG: TetR/AcrR family transcriptional regulator [Haloechinothrix sp.]